MDHVNQQQVLGGKRDQPLVPKPLDEAQEALVLDSTVERDRDLIVVRAEEVRTGLALLDLRLEDPVHALAGPLDVDAVPIAVTAGSLLNVALMTRAFRRSLALARPAACTLLAALAVENAIGKCQKQFGGLSADRRMLLNPEANPAAARKARIGFWLSLVPHGAFLPWLRWDGVYCNARYSRMRRLPIVIMTNLLSSAESVCFAFAR